MAEMPEISGVPKLSSGAMTAPGETSLKKKPIVTPTKKPAVAKSLSSRRNKFYQQEGFDRDAHAEQVTSAMGSMLGGDSGGMQGLIEGLGARRSIGPIWKIVRQRPRRKRISIIFMRNLVSCWPRVSNVRSKDSSIRFWCVWYRKEGCPSVYDYRSRRFAID